MAKIKPDIIELGKASDPEQYQESPVHSFHVLRKYADFEFDLKTSKVNDTDHELWDLRQRACGTLGQVYYWGANVKKDEEKARYYFNRGKSYRNSVSIFFSALFEIKDGNYKDAIDDLTYLLWKADGGPTKIGTQLGAGEALYILRNFFEMNNLNSELEYYYDKLRRLWDGYLYGYKEEGWREYVRGLIMLYDLLPEKEEEVKALMKDESFPYSFVVKDIEKERGDVRQRAKYYLFYQKIAYAKGNTFASGIIDKILAASDLTDADRYIQSLPTGSNFHNLDLMDRFPSGWANLDFSVKKKKKKSSEEEPITITGILTFLLTALMIAVPIGVLSVVVNKVTGMSMKYCIFIGVMLFFMILSKL